MAVDALQKGTNTWFVWATATVTNDSNAVVDVLLNVWVSGAADPAQENSDIGLDPVSEAQSLPIGQNAPIPYSAPDPVTVPVGQSATIALRGFHPLAADGSNAVAYVKPTTVSGGGILRRWADTTQRSSCAAPGESVSFPLVSTTPGGLIGWPGM